MGYTHYWYRRQTVNAMAKYEALCNKALILGQLAKDKKDIEQVINRRRSNTIPTTFTNGLLISQDYIEIRGDYENLLWGINHDAHTHLTSKDKAISFTFCKTNWGKDDTLVCAFLIYAKQIYGDDVSISSDGTWHDWSPAQRLIQEAFGTEPQNVLGDAEWASLDHQTVVFNDSL